MKASATRRRMKLWPSTNERKPMPIVNQISEITNGHWLPDMDLNHDKQIQSLLCYRYTIGQAGAFDRLKGFANQSSRQTGSALREMNVVYARPHPGPLPRGEGEARRTLRKIVHHNFGRRHAVVRAGRLPTIRGNHIAYDRRMILPLLGERAGVRAVVATNVLSRFTFHLSRN
jgi:hypothetical protein